MKTKIWVLLLVVSCASSILAPEIVRQKDFLENTKVKPGTAYTRALRWFDKNLRYVPGGAARTEDSTAGKMKIEGGYVCNKLRKPSDFRDHYLSFVLDFESIPGAVGMHFTQLRMEDQDGQLLPKPEIQLSTQENTDLVQPCLKKVVASLMKAVESDKLTW